MNARDYLIIAVVGAVLVIVFSPSLFYLVVEGGLPKTPIDTKVLKSQNYTIESRKLTIPRQVNVMNHSLPVTTVGKEYQIRGAITSNSSLTFLLLDHANLEIFLMGGDYNSLYKNSISPGSTLEFAVNLETDSSYDLELLFLKTVQYSSSLDLSLKGFYSIEVTGVTYVTDFVKGLLFPSLCAIGLVLLVYAFVSLRKAARAPAPEYVPAVPGG